MHLLIGRAPQEQRKGVTLSVGFYYEFTTGLVSFESLHISKRQKKRQYNFTATNFSISSVSWDHISVKGILLFKGIFMLMLQLAQTIVLMLKHARAFCVKHEHKLWPTVQATWNLAFC